MYDINLLPWRARQRTRRDRVMLINAFLCCFVVMVFLYLTYNYMYSLKDSQESRNYFLQSNIAALEMQIKEMEQLKKDIEQLIARVQVMQNLQHERFQVVHLLEDMVRKLPQGVYFRAISKKGKSIKFDGTADSNATISTLMQQLESSDWFIRPDLDVVRVTSDNGIRLSDFSLHVFQPD